MATFYVYHGGSNTAPYNSWATAATTLSAITATAGDVIYIASDHSEVLSAHQTYSFTGTGDSPVVIISRNRLTDVYEPASSPQIDADHGAYTIQFDNAVAVFGIYFKIGYKFYAGGVNDCCFWEDCIFHTSGTYSNYAITYQGQMYDGYATFINCTFRNDTRNYHLIIEGNRRSLAYIGCTFIQAAATVTDCPIDITGGGTNIIMRGCDFSGTTAPYLIDPSSGNRIEVSDCVLNSATAGIFNPATTTHTNGGLASLLLATNCSASNLPALERRASSSTFLEETGVYRMGTTVNGTPMSLRADTGSDRSIATPLDTILYEGVVDASTSKTFTVEIARDGTTEALTDQDIWLLVGYPDATTTRMKFVNGRGGPGNNGNAYPDSTTTWTGLSATEKRQKISLSIPGDGKSGVVVVYVMVAIPNTTIFIDPDVTIT